MSARGVEVINTGGVSLSNMTFTNAATTDAATNCDNLVNSGCHAAIHLESSSAVVLTNVDISTSAQQGINGLNVTGFTLANSTVTQCGDEVSEGCLRLVNLGGFALISASDLSFAAERVAQIENTNTNLALTALNSTFRDTQSSMLGADGLEVASDGSSNTNIDVVNSSFLRNHTNGLQVLSEDTAIVGVDVSGSTFDRGAGIGIGMDLAAAGSAALTFNVIDNPLINSRGSSAVNVFADGSATVQGRVNDNTIQAGGNTSSGFGIRAQANSNANVTLEIDGNTISDIGFDAGIQVLSRLGGTGRLDATINGNDVTVDATNSLYDIWVQAQDSNTTCANVTNNTTSGVAIAAFRARTVDMASTVILQGAGATAAAVWSGNGNTPAAGPVSSSHNGTLILGDTCNTVSHPQLSSSTAAARAAAPRTGAETINVAIGTLPPGKAITLTFDATGAASVPAGVTQVSNQGTVQGISFPGAVSDDPATATPGDPTVTPLDVAAPQYEVFMPLFVRLGADQIVVRPPALGK